MSLSTLFFLALCSKAIGFTSNIRTTPRPLDSSSQRISKRWSNTESSEPIDALSEDVSSDTFDWLTEWYPILPIQDLSRTTPNKVTLLGKDFVVWHDGDSFRAFADACPHRLVPLSEGRLERNGQGGVQLQCAYHGWEFNSEGACTRIPQLTATKSTNNNDTNDFVSSPRACATPFPVREEQGLLWLFPSSDALLAATKVPALIPELDDPSFVDGTNFFVRDMPYSWDILVENLCDPAHVPFAHHSFMRGADRTKADSLSIDLEVTKEQTSGFSAQRIGVCAGQYDVKFTAPTLLYYRISNSAALAEGRASSKAKQNFIGLGQYCVPTAPGQCRLIARFPLRIPVPAVMWLMKKTPRWITHFNQNVVMDSDVIFLCSQDEYLDNNHKLNPQQTRNKAKYYMPALCDTLVVAFRRWLETSAGGQPSWLGLVSSRSQGEPLGWIRPQNIPAKVGRDALLDRFRQHTDICSSCRRAHLTLCRIRSVLKYSGALLIIATAAVQGGTSTTKLRLVLATASALLLMTPPLILRPIISRLECAPWPRKKWMAQKS
mmetsp:Transcript_18054/g.39147  ORF Transcript_18054/g.39147 Transcript_18054/m.39147 type:complete len:548 (-) Transcript_18054:1522-3165(-)